MSNNNRKKIVRKVIGFLFISSALTSCTTQRIVEQAQPQNGKSLLDAQNATKTLSAKYGEVVYDVSFPLFHQEPTFKNTNAGNFVVIADCIAPNGHALAVIPRNLANEGVLAKAEHHGFNWLLLECKKDKRYS